MSIGKDAKALEASIQARADAKLDALEAERDRLRDALSSIRRRAIFGPGLTVGDLLDLTGCVAPQDEPTVERQRDATNPFAPRERPQKPIRLMTEAERRAAGLAPNGGFDGPTGAD